MPSWIELYTQGDSALLMLARGYKNQALAAAEQVEAARAEVAQNRGLVADDRAIVVQRADEVAGNRTLVAEDRALVVLRADEVAANRALVAGDRATVVSRANEVAANTGLVAADRVAALAAAQAAAATIPILGDRTVGRRPGDTATWSMIRATPAWGFGPDGALVETPVDTLRWEFDPVTRAPLGVAFAGARTNVWGNPLGVGAVAGSPGTRPTLSGTIPTGVTMEQLGPMTVNGIPGWAFRLVGVPSTTAAQAWALGGQNNCNVGDLIQTAGWFAMLAGSMANVSFLNLRGHGGSDAGLTLATGGSPLTATPQFFRRPWTATTGTGIQPVLRWQFQNTTDPVDISIFVGAGQQRIAAPFLDAPIFPAAGTTGSSTRAQGNVSQPVQQFGTRWNYRQGLILLDWNSAPGPFTSALDADWFGLISWGDTTADNRMGLLINPAHTSIEARMTSGGAVQAPSAVTIPAPAAGATTRALLAWNLDAVSPGNGFMQVCARGVAGTKVPITTLPTPGFLMLGRFGTSNPGFIGLPGFDLRPVALFDGEAAALTA